MPSARPNPISSTAALDSSAPLLITVTGATASGKTSMAINLARELGTEIISADSRQIYKDIPITTAAPTPDERAQVRHHFVECQPLDAYYSASRFESEALAVLDDVFRRCGCAVLCGGSMMYIDALTRGIDDMPQVSDSVRQRVFDIYHSSGLEGVMAMLQVYDPQYAAQVDSANTRRVMHALEMCLQSGRPYSELRTGASKERPFRVLKLAIDLPRDLLFDRINSRVEAMIEAGMEDEARRMLPLRHLNSLNTVGFKEWFDYFDGKFATRRECIERIKKNTRVYAKKQLTWLRRDPSVVWVKPSQSLTIG